MLNTGPTSNRGAFVWAGSDRAQRARPTTSAKNPRNAGGTSVRRSMCVVSVARNVGTRVTTRIRLIDINSLCAGFYPPAGARQMFFTYRLSELRKLWTIGNREKKLPVEGGIGR